MDDFRDLERFGEEFAIPEEALETVSPWKPAMKKLLWGLALNALTIRNLGLDLILPALGVALIWLGWRSLRRDNPWFRAGWWAGTALLVLRFASLVLMATPATAGWEQGWLAGSWVNLVLLQLQYLCLWRGLDRVFRRAEQPARTGAALGLLLWYLILLPLGATAPQGGWLVFLPMVLAYFLLIRSMWKVTRSLAQAGYALEPAPVKVSDRRTLCLLALALAVAIGGCLLAFDRFPAQEERRVRTTAAMEAERTEITGTLTGLGYPEELAADLSLEDLRRCRTAVGVESGGALLADRSYWDEPGCLDLRTVSVVLADGSCRFFSHFRWTEEPDYRGLESIEVVPLLHKYLEELAGNWGNVSARLLYERDGILYETDFYTLETIYVPMENPDEFDRITAEFSLPQDCFESRGYIAYDLTSREPGTWINFNMTVDYTRRKNPWSYPWKAPLEAEHSWGETEYPFLRAGYWGLFTMYSEASEAWEPIVSQKNTD